MIAVPSIAMLLLVGLLSLVASSVTRRPSTRWIAIVCGVSEIIMAGFLIFIVCC
jgi:hypothetical protein